MAYRLLVPGSIFLARMIDSKAAKETSNETYRIRSEIIDHAGREIPVKIYQPRTGHHRTLLLLHGVHFGGFEERRLVRFARLLAGMGYAVATPDLVDLKSYSIIPRAVDDIERSALWLLGESGLVRSGEGIGILGISFAGGLSISAASRPSLKDKVEFVFSFGGHAGLAHTMRYLCTGEMDNGEKLTPHIYGQAVLARQFASQLVPEKEVAQFRTVLLEYLEEKFKKVRKELYGLPPTSKKLVRLCLDRNTEELGKILIPIVNTYSPAAVLSPIEGTAPSCPIFLLHGAVDNVIPPSESRRLGVWAANQTETTVLISELIRHVDIENGDTTPSVADYYKIIRFWTELLRI
jgi:dienelactone hydrolase